MAATANEKVIRIRLEAVGSGTQQVNNQLASIVAAGGGANTTLSTLTTSFGRVGSAANGAGGMLSAANSNARLLSGGMGTLQASLANATQRLGAFNGVLSNMAFAGASAGALGLAGAISFAVSVATAYADKMAEISTLVDTATFSMDGLNKGLQDQAIKFGAAPVDQAKAAYDIISSGATSAAGAIDQLNAANTLAVATNTNVMVAADGLTSVMNAYAGQSLQSKDAIDSMFLAVRDGKIEMNELASSLGQVAPLAATMGVSFDQLNASVAALTKGGVQGSVAITNIRAALSSIIKPSSEASKLADKLGLDYSAAALKAKGWPAFLEEVRSKTKGSQEALATLSGGTEALSATLALTTTASKDFNTSLENMKNKSGAANEALEKMQNASPSFQLNRIMAELKVIGLEVGQTLLTVVVPAIKFVADNMMTAWTVSKALAASFAVYRGLSIASTFLQGATALGTLSSAAGALNSVIGIATKAQAIFNTVVLANPFVFIAAAITGIIALLYQFRDSIALGGGSVATLGDLFRVAFEGLPDIINGVKSAFTSAMSAIGSAISGVTSFLGSAFSTPLNAIKDLFASAFGDLDFSISGILIGAARTADGIVGVFHGGLAALVALWNGLPAALGPNFQAVLAGAKTLVVGIGNGIASVWNSIVSFGQSIAATTASIFNSVGSFIERWVNKAISGINSVIGGANKLGANIAPLASITIGNIVPPKADTSGYQKLGQAVGAAWASGFGHENENAVKGLLKRANASHQNQGAATNTNNGGGAGGGTLPTDPKKKGNSDAADRAKRENDYWEALKGELATARSFGLVAQQITKERELQKILSRDLSTAEKLRVDTAVADIANAKAVTSIKQRAFELANENSLEGQRTLGLTEQQKSVEDEVFKYRLSALNSGANIQSDAYKIAEADLKTQLDKNAALKEQTALLAKATDIAKKYSPSLQMGFDLKEIDKERDAFLKAYDAGTLKDALGNPLTTATRDAVLAGIDQAALDIRNKPLEILAKISPTVSQALEVSRVNAEHNTNLAYLNDPNTNLTNDQRKQAIKDEANYYRDQMSRATSIVANAFTDKLSNAIDGLADLFSVFSDKLGGAIRGLSSAVQKIKDMQSPDNPTGQLLTMISGKLGDGFKTGAANMGDWQKGMDSIGDPLKGLTDAFKGPGGSAIKGIGAAVGGAMAGAQIGSAVGGIGTALGANPGFSKGASLGGTLGGLTGNPIVAAAASVIGGILGSLFYKPPSSSATFAQQADGTVGVGTVRGTNSQLKAAANSMAGSVLSGLNDIAGQLGGKLTGTPNVTVGTWDGKYRVADVSTSSKLHYNNFNDSVLHDFGKDGQEAAIAYAIKKSIEQGVITGLSDLANKAIRALDTDDAVSLVQDFNSAMKTLGGMLDPVKQSVLDIVEPLKSLRDRMVDVGASTEDLTKLDQLRTLQLAAALKDQLSSLTDFKKALSGDGSGVTKLSQLTSAMAQFEDYKSKIASGDSSINQADFTSLGQDIFSLARDVYGTATSQFQDIRTMLTTASDGLIGNVTTDFNNAANPTTPATTPATDPTSAAIANMTAQQIAALNALKAQLGADNALVIAYLKQIADANAAGQQTVYSYGGGVFGDGYNGLIRRV